jgi:predicted 2-oxoglutarate/Fe(II)-dependent dioxygenase YbiX
MTSSQSDFYIICREVGAENPSIPTWASHRNNPFNLSSETSSTVTRAEIPEVPGAFQIHNILSETECEKIIECTESLNYLEDAAVSLPRRIRHNNNVTWVADDDTIEILWNRCKPAIVGFESFITQEKALGLNGRFRCYRYEAGDFFAPHTDGSWPGSRVINGELIANAYPDRWSIMSIIIFLSDHYQGGATEFEVGDQKIAVKTPAGSALCFPHGTHPMHYVHASQTIKEGTKYIIRSDILFSM